MISLYKLSHSKLKKGMQLTLYKDNEYIASITKKGRNKKELVDLMKDKVGLDLDWEKLYENLVYNKCGWCGKNFKKNKKRLIYCSDNCAYEARLNNMRLLNYKRYKNEKEHKRITIHEYINNKGYFPKGFTEFDQPNTIGESNLTEKPQKDKKKEYEKVQKELKRFGLR